MAKRIPRSIIEYERAANCFRCGCERIVDFNPGLMSLLRHRTTEEIVGTAPIYASPCPIGSCGMRMIILLDPQTSHVTHGWN